MRREQEMVREFHVHTGQAERNFPQVLTSEEASYRNWIMQGELDELKHALQTQNLIEIADGLGDLLYTVLGTAVLTGIDLEPIFHEIHRSNMTKDRHPLQGQTEDAKPIKGARFERPRIESMLLQQGVYR